MFTTRLRRSMGCLWLLWLMTTTTAAWGQDARKFPLERLTPAMDHQGVIDVESAAVPAHARWEAAFWLRYADDSLVLNRETDNGGVERISSIVESRVGASVTGAVALFDWVEVGAELPMVLYQSGSDNLDSFSAEQLGGLTASGLGDLRVSPKIRILRARDHGVDVAVLGRLTFPTATSTSYLGEAGVSFSPEVALSRSWARVRGAVNVGYVSRPRTKTLNLVVDDEITYRLGIAYDLQGSPVELAAALSGSTGAKIPFRRVQRDPLEVLLAANFRAADTVALFLGGGAGVVAGWSVPDFRLFAGVRFMPPAEPAPAPEIDDADGDGIVGAADACPEAAEDFDKHADDDGCPDPDNDGDGIADAADKCPLQAENVNGWEDADGCPDEIVDSDGDGILDPDDRCEDKPEDKDGFADDDGCPDPDNDKDGVVDNVDNCPDVAGSAANFGCPTTDRDGDGVADGVDICPDDPGVVEFDGCAKRQLVKLSEEKIEILEQVLFNSGAAVISSSSFALLDNVAAVLAGHPEIKVVRIEGHTDNRGSARFNKSLSQRRAEAVMKHLVSKGLAAARLEAVGYGPDRPIAPNLTQRGRAANRRVEFHIVREAE